MSVQIGKTAKKVTVLLALCSTLVAVGACSRSPKWTAEERLNAQLVLLAWRASNEAARFQNSLSRGKPTAQKDIDRLAAKLRLAISLAEKADEHVLAKIHPGLRARWRGQFVEGMRQRLKNLESADGAAQAEWLGSEMVDRFGDWISANRRHILIPELRDTDKAFNYQWPSTTGATADD